MDVSAGLVGAGEWDDTRVCVCVRATHKINQSFSEGSGTTNVKRQPSRRTALLGHGDELGGAVVVGDVGQGDAPLEGGRPEVD